ncbi:MAG: c-type cytochrome [Proteobacteria bacterium]|nr:c-type cytochrome [Pseudomonadota bacterium]
MAMKSTIVAVAKGATALMLLLGAAMPASGADPTPATPASMARGKAVYMRECVACHGDKGNGDGPGAHIVNPAPRNFELGVFKLRTTPSGAPPTDQDLFRTITQGVPGTAMPSFRELPEQERWALVAVVKQFASIEAKTKPIDIPAEPRVTPVLLERGKAVYTGLKCFNCHGAEGRGDGSSSLTLKDDAKKRIWAPDLTAGAFKSGKDPKALYARIATGLDGTPMPSYAAEASPDDIWALVEYVRSLVRK